MWKRIKDIGEKINNRYEYMKNLFKRYPVGFFTILFFITVGGCWVASSHKDYLTWEHDCKGGNEKCLEYSDKHPPQLLYSKTYKHNSATTTEPNKDIDSFLYFVSGAASLGLLIVAFSQFTLLNRTNKNTELLQIDKRWASKEIIIARQIIHAIYREINHNRKRNNSCCKNEACYLNEKISNFNQNAQKAGEILYALSDSPDDDMQRAFIYIQHYIDLMESLAFIYKEAEDDELDELTALLGDSIVFNYFMFKGFIDCCNSYIPIKSTMKRYRFLPRLVKTILEKDDNLKDKAQNYTSQFDANICEQIKSGSKNVKDVYFKKIKKILKSNNV